MSLTPLCLLWLLAGPPELDLRTGDPVTLDGKVEEAEWKEAFALSRDVGEGAQLRLRMMRTGPFMAFAVEGNRTYAGEILRLYVSDEEGVQVTALVCGLGHGHMPPAIWRKGSPNVVAKTAPESGRCVRSRIRVAEEGRWSAEILVRLSGLGIGRGDLRTHKALVALTRIETGRRQRLLVLPGGAEKVNLLDPARYAVLKSPDAWGAEESWVPVEKEESREYDDNALLHRLHLEYAGLSQYVDSKALVIATAIAPKSRDRIRKLVEVLEGARSRNPTLPAWTYYLGRLLHESNQFARARKVVESVPKHLLGLEAFANLAIEHYTDTGVFDRAEELCERHARVYGVQRHARELKQVRKIAEAEGTFLERDRKKPDKNPVVRIKTKQGEFEIELFEDDAPNATTNFVDLVSKRSFYDDLRCHSVKGGRFVQLGDPRTRKGFTGKLNGPGWKLLPDRSPRLPVRGSVLMVAAGRAMHGSQFMILTNPIPKKTKGIVVFGRVRKGMDVVDSLEQGDAVLSMTVVQSRSHDYVPLGRLR